MKLTPKQEAFCLAYLKTGNASEVYRRAYDAKGMKDSTIHVKASELLADGKVRARFEELSGKVTVRAVEKAAISKAWVIEKLVSNVERAMQAEPVRRQGGDDEDGAAGEYVYNGSVANKALELLGKEIGMFVDRKEVGGLGEFSRMSDEELHEVIAEDLAVIYGNGHDGAPNGKARR